MGADEFALKRLLGVMVGLIGVRLLGESIVVGIHAPPFAIKLGQ